MVDDSPFLIHLSTTLWVLGSLAFIASSVWLSVVDLSTRKIPNKLVLRLTVTTLGLFAASVCMMLPTALRSSAVIDLLYLCGGAAALFAVFYLLWRMSPRSIGGGDVKTAPIVGGFLGFVGGFWAVLVGGILAFAVAAIWGALLRRRAGGTVSTVPFAPCLFIGAWLTVLGTLIALLLF